MRAAGCKVSVRHHRRYVYVPPEDVYLMRHEVTPENMSPMQGYWRISATGGFCDIRITFPDKVSGVLAALQPEGTQVMQAVAGQTFFGRSECSVKDCYNKRLARGIAIGRALNEAFAAIWGEEQKGSDSPLRMPVYADDLSSNS